jgi:hypothetical protein
VLHDHEDKLWKIPDPPPTHNDESAAIVARLKVLNKWLDWRGGLRCVTRIVERIHKWEEIETDGTDYHSPIHESDDDRIDGRLTDEHLDLVGAIGSLASLIIEANRCDETELLGIVESDPNTYRFTYLDDLRWEYEQNHEKPVEPRRLEKLLRCGSCCESYPWNGEYPYRCPKCEADKRERDVVTKSKSEEPKKDRTLEDGLYPDERCLVWGGRRFDRLTKKMVAILGVFVEAYSKGRPVVSLSAIKIKTKLRFDGSFIKEAFKLNRKGGPLIHDVSKAIEKIADGDYQLIDPLQIEKIPE